MAGGVTTITTMRVKPGTEAAVAAAMRPLINLTRSEPGCQRYEPAQLLDDPTAFVVVAEWSSPDAVIAHTRYDHTMQWMADHQGEMAGPPVTEYLHPVE